MISSKAILDRSRRRVDRALGRLFDARPDQPALARLLDAMFHLVDAGGKRLRPCLVYEGARLVDEDVGAVVDAAAVAVELVHTASLIHDDLPALDDDRLRRGRATVHTAYDEATAILAGDALIALAFEVLATASGPPARRLDAISELARASGWQGICGGQVIDMQGESRRLSTSELDDMNDRKTGRIIEASAVMGFLLAGGPGDHVDALRRYGAALGRAFQLRDDLLDATGDPALLGKAVGRDDARCKSTYVTQLGVRGTQSALEAETRRALDALAVLDARAEPLRALVEFNACRQG